MSDDLIAETEAKIKALQLRLPELEGKANKKERTAVNKEIYALENDEAYVAALKAAAEGRRAAEAVENQGEVPKATREVLNWPKSWSPLFYSSYFSDARFCCGNQELGPFIFICGSEQRSLFPA